MPTAAPAALVSACSPRPAFLLGDRPPGGALPRDRRVTAASAGGGGDPSRAGHFETYTDNDNEVIQIGDAGSTEPRRVTIQQIFETLHPESVDGVRQIGKSPKVATLAAGLGIGVGEIAVNFVIILIGGVFFAAPLFYHLTHYGWAA